MNRNEFFELLGGMSFADLSEIQSAYWLAKNAHRMQPNRDSGERYFEHPRDVAVTLINRGIRNRSAIIKALLHDVIEDTNTPIQVILGLFGHDIWHSLAILSKYVPTFDPVTGQTIGRYKKTPEVYFNELFEASQEDRLVKLADRYQNMSTMDIWVPDRRTKYAMETRDHILPIAEITDPWFFQELQSLIHIHLNHPSEGS